MSREILLLVDALAREKNVDKETVFLALEFALVSATKKRFPAENIDVRIVIDRNTGEHEAYRRWVVVEDENLDDPDYEIQLMEAQKQIADIRLGDFIEQPLGGLDFGRIGAQAAKQVILQKIREAERQQVISDFLERNNKLVSGIVKRLDRGNLIVECGKVECLLRRDNMIPKENLRVGDRVRAYLEKVDRTQRGPAQIELSRVSPQFLVHLFKLEVPEIEEGLLEIKSAARDPGFRAKLAVKANDSRIDPVGTCVGIRGFRVQAVTQELAGERVDIVLWSPDHAQFVINALAPSEVTSVVVDEENRSMDVIVDESNLAAAIGSRGQNVRLATELTGWNINLMTVEEKSVKEEEESLRIRSLFVSALNIDETTAVALMDQGFETLEEMAYVPVDEILETELFTEEEVNALRLRARDFLLAEAIAVEEKVENLNGDILSVDGMDRALAIALWEKEVRSRDDLADLSVDDLVELVGVDAERARQIIIDARRHWFSE